MKHYYVSVLAAMGAVAVASAVYADPISSYTYHLTSNTVITAGQSAVIGSQIQTYLRDNGDGTVTFHFENIGSFTDCISEIYFQDGAWLQPPPSIVSSSNPNVVKWVVNATPASLPGGTGANPPFITDCSLDSQALQQGGQAKNGINNNPTSPYVQGDWLNLTFKYVNGINFQGVINGFNASDPAKRLEIGFHATGYFSSASVVEWHAVPTAAPLPSPASAGLVFLGAMGLLQIRRRRGRTVQF